MPDTEPVALVGVGCRFPGVRGPAQLWRALLERRCVTGAPPPERLRLWGAATSLPPSGFLRGVDEFDAAFFGISPREALHMDPQQRMLLETAWEAFEDAGIRASDLAGKPVGVYVGAQAAEHWELGDGLPRNIYSVVGSGLRAGLSGRLSYAFDLRGPALTVDTACASSMSSLHLAVRALRGGECEVALACGTNLALIPQSWYSMQNAGMLSADGLCKFGDASADGFARSEGVAVVVLKALSRALADGDDIYAQILGSGVSSDGQASGYLTAPGVEGQRDALLAAYADAGVDPADVDYVEAHGTGTAIGDPVELRALGSVLGVGRESDRPCLVGSVKSNLGHTEGAAGLAGVIKTALCLKNRHLPASLHVRHLTEAVDWPGLGLSLHTEAGPWPRDRERLIAGVSSFGIVGTNAHVVMASAPAPASAPPEVIDAADDTHLLVLSARDPQALRDVAQRYQDFLGEASPADVCFSAAEKRTHLEHRAAVVGSSREELRSGLASVSETRVSGQDRRVVFVFPGQGSQWDGMGKDLLAREPVFRAGIEECSRLIAAEAGWSLLELVDRGELTKAPMGQVQPALFAMQVALARTWQAFGLEPDTVIGHSMGEVAAAHIAGALSLEDAVAVICRRSALLGRIAGQGAMVQVALDEQAAHEEIEGFTDRVAVAVVNGPSATVLSGEVAALEEVCARLTEREIACQWISVEVASHSPQVDAVCDELLKELQDLRPKPASVPMWSTVLNGPIEDVDAAYWARNLREPVRFWSAVNAVKSAAVTYVEVSPHPVLLGSVMEALGEDDAAIPTLRRDQPERRALLTAAGQLYTKGHNLNWPALTGSGARFVRLPTYPWRAQRHWHAQPQAVQPALLGTRHDTADGWQVWEGPLDLKRNAYLFDHQVQGEAIFPGVGYLELAMQAARQLGQDLQTVLSDVVLHRALFLNHDDELLLRLRIGAADTERRPFEVSSRRVGEATWTAHASGSLSSNPGSPPPPQEFDEVQARFGRHVTGAEVYEHYKQLGNDWRTTFQGVTDLWRGDGEVLTRVCRPKGVSGEGFVWHPTLLDSVGHSIVALGPNPPGSVGGDLEASIVGGGFGRLRLYSAPTDTMWCHARLTSSDETGFRGTAVVTDENGRVLAEADDAYIRFLTPAVSQPADDGRLQIAWEAAAALPQPSGGHYLIFADGGGVADDLAAHLAARGARCTLAYPGEDVSALLSGSALPTDIVHMSVLDANSLVQSRDHLAHLIDVLRFLSRSTAITVVTRGAQAADGTCQNPSRALLWGLGRTAMAEYPALHCKLVDLDSGSSVEALAAELSRADEETQVALRGGRRLVPRLRPHNVVIQPVPDGAARCLVSTGNGLGALHLEAAQRREPGYGEVAIDVSHAEVSFRAVLLAVGQYDDQPYPRTDLGSGFAGRVRAVGSAVTGLAVGDPVIAFASGPIADHIVVPQVLVQRTPNHLGPAEAATIPGTFATAHYALDELARLRPGETVLIHCAAGGVGLATVQLARHMGATVIATAGSEYKRSLLRHMGIEFVGDSRSTSYTDLVNEVTRGRGVDVVINMLSGVTRAAGFGVLAPHGRWVELTKKIALEAASAPEVAPVSRPLSFFALDILDLALRQPERLERTMREIADLASRGKLLPLPHHVFPAAQASTAFDLIARAQQVGRLILSFEPTAERTSAHSVLSSVPSGTAYLITGGLGGIGTVLARWLIERGARHLLLTGRTPLAEHPSASQLRELQARADVHYVAVDAADEAGMRGVLDQWARDGKPPVRGVLHAAGAAAFNAIEAIGTPDLAEALDGKAAGADVLDRLFSNGELDFFVLFSSFSALLPSPLLGAYAAANAYLDALAWHRRGRGQAATSVNWAFWDEVGIVARMEGSRVPQGMRGFSPREALAALDSYLAADVVQAVLAPTDWPRWAVAHPTTAGNPLLRELLHSTPPPIASPAPEPTPLRSDARDYLRASIGEILHLSGLDLDPGAPLNRQGMDSLMASELRARIRADLGKDIPVVKFLGNASISSLSDILDLT
ncbi:type I polyketide synthase [Allokutzneria sp. NRRL B-24872]|uniref:type I polyketide synthase n=1 Tax=Allokutzneria sp. NRRL B-24872 TaxID=1137961 RepID=UPI00143DAEE6|nr:type I polyketide synthase [Allokutzneria sp. NRRL B-24872]